METENQNKDSLNKYLNKNERRPKELTFRGIITEGKEKWLNIAFPQKPKGTSKSPFLGLVYGAIKNMKDSFENGNYDLPIDHKFKEWDRVTITFKQRQGPMENKDTPNGISFPIVVVQAGEKWISGIFPLKDDEASDEDYSYDFPIDHEFIPYDELLVTIERTT